MESITGWQVTILCGIALWIVVSSILNLTGKIRSLTQPWVSHCVLSGTPIILRIQKYQNTYLDALFSGMSCVVSVPFYTAFLPFLFWTGHCKLARQMTLLMAFCDYVGNCTKDVVSAPRPSSSLVRRLTATKDEEENAMEYGLPSSHTLNTVCLSGYELGRFSCIPTHVIFGLLKGQYDFAMFVRHVPMKYSRRYLFHYIMFHSGYNVYTAVMGFSMVCLVVGLIGLGRIYLGMHSLIDVIVGLAMGLGILAIWLSISEYLDNFIVSGPNVASFWATLSFLLLFAYPTPECSTPSFEFHTAFNGVSLGIVIGVHLTFHQFHHENVAQIFSPQLPVPTFVGRILLGIPTILVVKYCSKALAKWIVPILANALGIQIRSTSYLPALKGGMSPDKKLGEVKQSGYVQKLFFFSEQTSFDVDTGIRFIQYSGLAWSVVDLVPSLFSFLGL